MTSAALQPALILAGDRGEVGFWEPELLGSWDSLASRLEMGSSSFGCELAMC